VPTHSGNILDYCLNWQYVVPCSIQGTFLGQMKAVFDIYFSHLFTFYNIKNDYFKLSKKLNKAILD